MNSTETRHDSKTRFLDAALHVIRAKGYSATRIEDVCEAAGLTKGSFFYHFESKKGLALEAADYWRPCPSKQITALCVAQVPGPANSFKKTFLEKRFRQAFVLRKLFLEHEKLLILPEAT